MYKENFGRKTDMGVPRSIMLWRDFHGNVPALDHAIQIKDVWQKVGEELHMSCIHIHTHTRAYGIIEAFAIMAMPWMHVPTISHPIA